VISKEVTSKIRKIEIKTKKLVNEIFSGEYTSVFKGQGMEFLQVREYLPGDDVRIIDWNVSARYGKLFVKQFNEERELNIFLIVDLSGSGIFGSAYKTKNEIASEIASILAFSALKNNDKVGLMLFTDKIEKSLSPKKGRRHILRIIREILYFKPSGRGTNIDMALRYLNKVIKRKAVVFILSDFFDSGYEKSMKIVSKKHDLIAISINDPRESVLPDAGLIQAEDPESLKRIIINTSDKDVRNKYKELNSLRKDQRDYFLKTMNVDHVEISTDRPYVNPLVSFFKTRIKRKNAGNG